MRKLTAVRLDENEVELLRQKGNISEHIRAAVRKYLETATNETGVIKKNEPRNEIIPRKKKTQMGSLLSLIAAQMYRSKYEDNKTATLMTSEGLACMLGRWERILEISDSLQFHLKQRGIEMFVESDRGLNTFRYHFPDGVNGNKLKDISEELAPELKKTETEEVDDDV